LGSRNGSYHDGVHITEIELTPNTVIELGQGGVRVTAVSPLGNQLRRALQRFLGFADPFLAAVDEAVHAVARRQHIVIAAPPGGQPQRLAQLIHEAWSPAPRPFVSVDHLGASRPKQRALLAEAAHGTLIVPAVGLPADLSHALELARAEQRD